MLLRGSARAVMLQYLIPATVRGSGVEHWARCAGGPPSWGNATGSAPPPWPAVNATMTPKAPYNSTGQSTIHTPAHIPAAGYSALHPYGHEMSVGVCLAWVTISLLHWRHHKLQWLHPAVFMHQWGLCCAGRSPTTTGDAAQQQLLSGILGALGLNGTAAPNGTSPAGSPSI